MKTTIHFIRHGRTKNTKRIVKGDLPIGLTKQGEKETVKLAKYLAANIKTAYIFYSPILRTAQTAKIFQKYFSQAKLIKNKELCEWLTPWQGYTIKQIQQMPKMQWNLYYTNPLKFHPFKKGETTQTVTKRMRQFVAQILKKYPGQDIIAVTHGDPIKLLRCFLEKGKITKDFRDYRCSQPSLTSLMFNGAKFQKTIYKSFIKQQDRMAQ